MKTDLELRRDVLDELEWEPSVNSAEIGVSVKEGVATLLGSVKNYAQKLAAGRIVERVRGVKAIANDIEVRLPGGDERIDADLARVAADALRWKILVPDDRIKVSVSRGWITLEGVVNWQYQKDSAFGAVDHLAGVRGVTNLIAVKAPTSAPDVKAESSRRSDAVPTWRRRGSAWRRATAR